MRISIVLLALFLSACGSSGGSGPAASAKSPTSPAVVAQSPWAGTYDLVVGAPGDTAQCFMTNGIYQCQFLNRNNGGTFSTFPISFVFDATSNANDTFSDYTAQPYGVQIQDWKPNLVVVKWGDTGPALLYNFTPN